MSDGTPIIIKKKKAHAHGHHGGSWKVAYADFVTAMMAFFMVMWILGLSAETKALIQGYFNDPLGFTKNEPKSRVNIQPTNGSPYSGVGMDKGTGEKPVQTEREVAKEMQRDIERAAESVSGSAEAAGLLSNLKLQITDEGLQLEFVENTGVVFFETGSATIRPIARVLIQRIAPILARSKRKMLIDGHTDARPYPSDHYDNWDLSNDRATAIRRALRSGGVTERQIIAVRAFADTRLKNPDDPDHFSNRRVTVLLPWMRDGESAVAMPREILSADVRAAFKKPVGIEPPALRLREEGGR